MKQPGGEVNMCLLVIFLLLPAIKSSSGVFGQKEGIPLQLEEQLPTVGKTLVRLLITHHKSGTKAAGQIASLLQEEFNFTESTGAEGVLHLNDWAGTKYEHPGCLSPLGSMFANL